MLDDGVRDKAKVPEYRPQGFFGKRCHDKVTGVTGVCVGRGVWLFNCGQYALEIQPEDESKKSRLLWLDDGRIEAVGQVIDPEEIQGSRPGGGGLGFLVYPDPHLPYCLH